jgi:hypothetical protein
MPAGDHSGSGAHAWSAMSMICDPAALADALLDQRSPARSLPDQWRPDADLSVYQRIIDDLLKKA